MRSLFLIFAIVGTPAFAQQRYPLVRSEPFDTLIHGVRLQDPFFWMERAGNRTELEQVAEEQTRFSRSMLDSLDKNGSLSKAMEESISFLDDEIWRLKPTANGYYYNRYFPGDGSWLCYTADGSSEPEKILKGVTIKGKQYAVRKKVFAFRKPLLAMMLTEAGENNPHIRIFNLSTREFLADSIGPVMFNDARGVSMAWSPDDASLFYTQAPRTTIASEKYFRGKIKVHQIGTPSAKDKPVFGIGLNTGIKLQAHETPYVYTFRNSPYVIARIRAGAGDNYAFAVHYSKLNGSRTPWKRLKDYVNLGEAFDAYGNTLYAATTGVPRYRVVKVNLETGMAPEPFLDQQEDVIAGTDVGHSSGIVAGQDVVYVLIRRVGAMKILMVDRKTGRPENVALKRSGTIAEMHLKGNNDLVFAFMTPVTSAQYLRYNYEEKAIKTLPFGEKVYSASDWLATKVIHVASRDGQRIPVSLVYPRNVDLNGNNPLIIEAYGNSGVSRDLYLDPHFLPWHRRGGVYAFAHVRGGGELGDEWANNGQDPHKMNSINDAADVAEYLVREGFTSPQKQVVMGGSAGSFIVGGVVNQRPDLFVGGLFLNGLPDIATYTDAAFGREQQSVGPRSTPEGWLSNLSVSSLYHIPENTHLPAMLVVHGATDYILGMSPAVRYIARLQKAQKESRPMLLLVYPKGGHLGSTVETIDILKFALWQTGHPDFQLAGKAP